MTITCHDHAHRYEFSWETTDNGPVITDLRVTSTDGTPISSATLRRINIERLASAAQLFDTPEQAATALRLQRTFQDLANITDPEEAMHCAADEWESWGFVDEANELRRAVAERGAAAVRGDSISKWGHFRGASDEAWMAAAESDSPEMMARVREQARGARRGRAPREFYRDVADWARDARTQGWPVYAHVADQSARWGRIDPSTDTIRRWIRRAEDEGFLSPGEIRERKSEPRKPKEETDER